MSYTLILSQATRNFDVAIAALYETLSPENCFKKCLIDLHLKSESFISVLQTILEQ